MADSVGTFSINSRRYLGNKFKLLGFIKRVIEENCDEVKIIADLFAGTGAVASGFSENKTVITNDILYCNYICNYAWFSPENFREKLIQNLILEYNEVVVAHSNYMSRNFADTYFSKEDCKKIGFIRENVERKYRTGMINKREWAILVTSLIYAMDRIAKTCGHYDAYRKGECFEEHLKLKTPLVSLNNNSRNHCFNEDVNTLISKISADVIYLDPPYNSRQYCDAYHLLENVARWQKPKLFGVAKKMDRTFLKSAYCTKMATRAFEALVEKAKSRYILLSYSNMNDKGNERSNARIKDEDILRILKRKGAVKIFEQNYKAFSTGKSEILDHKERLFLCICSK